MLEEVVPPLFLQPEFVAFVQVEDRLEAAHVGIVFVHLRLVFGSFRFQDRGIIEIARAGRDLGAGEIGFGSAAAAPSTGAASRANEKRMALPPKRRGDSVRRQGGC